LDANGQTIWIADAHRDDDFAAGVARQLLRMKFLPRLALLLFPILPIVSLNAGVTRVEIASRVDVLNGKIFGDVGAYERITGRVFFSLPVANPHNRRIVDLDKAINLKHGEVEFSADFVAIRPEDADKGNGSMILEVPNRGKPRITGLVDGGDWDVANDGGDGWLLRNGFTIVSLGWQWDAAGQEALRLYAPIAKDDGQTITGLLRGDLMPSRATQEIPLGHLILGNIGGSEYPVADPEDSQNTLTVRDSRNGERKMIPRSEWQFAHTVDGKLMLNNRGIHLNGGFQPGKIYEYIYLVADPVIAGGGFAVIRDFASYAKHARDAVTPAARVYGEGISQNGRFLRDFLYQGFNADEEGRIALDGVLAHVAGAGRGDFNYRFAQPSRDAQPTSSVSFPTDIFPFPIGPRPIRSPERLAAYSTVPLLKKSCPKFSSPTRPTNTGVERRLLFIPVPTESKMCRFRQMYGFIISPGCNISPGHSLRRREKTICLASSSNRRFPSATSGAL